MSIVDLDGFMRRVFGPGSEAIGALTAQLNGRSPLPRDYETAYNLLQRATEAFPVLMRRCEVAEAEVVEIRSQAQAEVAAAREVAAQWHHLALALKEKLEETETQITALEERVATAEADLATGRRQIDDAEQQAHVAMGITTLFHDKIVEAFGVGSPAHATLDILAKAAPKRTRDGD